MDNIKGIIKIIGWTGIIISPLAILGVVAMTALLIAELTGFYELPPNFDPISPLILSIAFSFLLIGGIQLLRFKKSGYRIYLTVAVIDIIACIYNFIHSLVIVKISDKLNLGAGLIWQLVIPVFIIYFFTRPKVKEQFK